MNMKLFDEYMKKGNRPSQNYYEWKAFLEICQMYLIKKGIENPVSVEIGIWRDKQRKFYEEFLGARHITIDISDRRGAPDILGDTHDPETKKKLEKRLAGKPINILFIDGGHTYKDAKRDFEMYSPLCTDIIAFHDIWCHRYDGRKDMQVWRYWNDLKRLAYEGRRSYKGFLFIDLFHYRGVGNRVQMGIGMILKP